MVKKDCFSGLFFIFLSIYICWQGLSLGIGSVAKPKAGFFPFWAGFSLGVVAIIVFLKAWVSKSFHEKILNGRIPWRNLLLAFGSMIGFNLSMKPLGFNFTAFLFLLILFRISEKRSWAISVLTSLGVTLGTYVVFELLLQARLPGGPFGFFGF